VEPKRDSSEAQSAALAFLKLTPLLLLFSVCAAQTAPEAQLPDSLGKALTVRMCAACHELKVVTAKRMSRQRWELSVDQMVSRGATGTDEEIEQVVEYLATNFGPANVNVNTANAAALVSKLGLSAEEGEAIVRRRQRNGAYRNWQEVAKTPGVDGKKIERAKDQIEF